jgi:flagellar biosynthesis/type III secretory pathway protein FliH
MSSRLPVSENAAGVSAEPFVFSSPGGENGSRSHAGAPWDDANGSGAQAEQKMYEKGLAEGEARTRAAFEKTLTGLRAEISESLRQFTIQRESYFQRVETEVVQLALSIARKILHREVQMDPLLLTGIVRVALESLNNGTQVRLRTNPQENQFWRDYFSQATDITPIPELIGDPSLDSGCCVLETSLGSTHISLETQLKEIEQGFLDLLEQRPQGRE